MKTKTALKKTKTALKVLERTMYNTRQSIHFKGMYELSGIKLRINIRKDSYDFQSYARVYVLNKEEITSCQCPIIWSIMAVNNIIKAIIITIHKVDDVSG